MQFTVRFYFALDDTKPVLMFLEDLRQKEPILHKLVVAGIKKIEHSEYHRPPLTEMVDKDHGILELRVGSANIARVFFFFRPGQEIVLTNGYVKKQQKVDTAELKKARAYKQDWEGRNP
ncbi:MAG TPA: type II toxin-antitoxin system RelE/ParE family toxin [Ktedonobacterales bacterium]|nr:type II toxin-antitoxin system RelE/ParE family toxin [Ktedonobacterales bacterium]